MEKIHPFLGKKHICLGGEFLVRGVREGENWGQLTGKGEKIKEIRKEARQCAMRRGTRTDSYWRSKTRKDTRNSPLSKHPSRGQMSSPPLRRSLKKLQQEHKHRAHSDRARQAGESRSRSRFPIKRNRCGGKAGFNSRPRKVWAEGKW